MNKEQVRGQKELLAQYKTIKKLTREKQALINSLLRERKETQEGTRKGLIEKICEIRDLKEEEKGKSLDYWKGYTKAITRILKIFK